MMIVLSFLTICMVNESFAFAGGNDVSPMI